MLNKRLHGQPGAESSGFSLEHQEQKRRDWPEEWASSASLAQIISCVSPEAHFQANLLQNLKHSNGWQRVGQDLVTKQQMGQKRSLSKLKNKWQIVRKHLQHVKKKKKPQFHILKNQQSPEKTGKGNEQVIYNKWIWKVQGSGKHVNLSRTIGQRN